MPAREYQTEDIRNVVVLGHAGSGKTTLIDTLTYISGTTDRRGDPRGGTAVTMYTEEEIAYGISLQLVPAYAEWGGVKVNLLDTPGYLDFTGEVAAGVRVADSALIVLDAGSGVEVGTERVWEYCEARSLPRFFFVSMMDREHADFEGVYQEVREILTDRVLPVEIPIGSGDSFHGIINLFSGRAHLYDPDSDSGEYEEGEIPPEFTSEFERWRNELIEAVAATDDGLLERYLEGEEIARDDVLAALKVAMLQGELYPLFCGAPERGWGTRALIRKLVELMPHPGEVGEEVAERPGIDHTVSLRAEVDGPPVLLIYKTVVEPHLGELSYFRVYGGLLESGSELWNARSGSGERLSQLAVALGRTRHGVKRLHPGDLGVTVKLRTTRTNDTLSPPERPLLLTPIEFPEPDIAVAVRAASRDAEERIGAGLLRLSNEDPTVHSSYDPELRQTILRGLGELHLEVQLARLRRKFGVEVLTPDEFVGDVIGDLNQRRGRILGMEPEGKRTRVRALVPLAELYRYATTLRSLTQGRAAHTRQPYGYEEVPAQVAQSVIDAAAREGEGVVV